MKSIITFIILAVLLILPETAAFAGTIYLENEWYKQGRPVMQFVPVQTTENPDYYQFTNGRYAFTIHVPREFTQVRFPSNGDGCIFLDNRGSTFSVSGSHNVLGKTVQQQYLDLLAKHPKAPFAGKGSDWCVISYLKEGYIVYEKYFINSEYINSWYFEYPQYLGPEYDPKCEHIEATFVPGWKTGLRILG